MLTRYADVVRTSRVFESYSSARKGCLLHEDRPDLDIARMLIDLDPPEHTRLRMLVSRGFTPRAVKSLDGHFREVTAGILDGALQSGTFDFVTEVASELPLIAIAELLGVPVEDRHKMFEWSNRMIGATDPEYGQGRGPRRRRRGHDRAVHVRQPAGRGAQARSPRRHHHDVAHGRRRRRAERARIRPLHTAAGGGRATRPLATPSPHGMLAFMEHPDQWSDAAVRPRSARLGASRRCCGGRRR